MKIRSLLLGSVAAAGLSTGGAFAADLGVLPSFDICDDLGLSGLTISSEDNCLVITGGVEYTFTWGDYENGGPLGGFGPVANTSLGDENYDWGGGINDYQSELDAWLQFAATSSTDFGKAKAVIKITNDADEAGYNGFDGHWEEGYGIGTNLQFDEAYVSIGDTTVITAGKTGTIFNTDDDEPLDWLGGYLSQAADTGVGFFGRDDIDGTTPAYDDLGGGGVIQVSHDLGNGFSVSGALENLDGSDALDGSAIGTVAYSGEGISAHVSVAAVDILTDVDEASFAAHAGFAGEFDNFKVVLAGAFADENYTGDDAYWNVLASASATFDIFTLAGAVEASSDEGFYGETNELGLSASISAEVTEGVSLNLGGRIFNEGADDWEDGIFEVAAGVTADVTETLEATAKVGFVDDGDAVGPFAGDIFYGEAGLTWKPGGDYEAGVTASVNSQDAYKIETTFKKEFQ